MYLEKKVYNNFPRQSKHPFYVSSDVSKRYNCIAWALGITDKWLEPRLEDTDPAANIYWPKGVMCSDRPEAYFQLFSKYGFKKCNSGDYENGYTKIAFMYHEHLIRPHALRLIQKDIWTSKMARGNDVIHTMETILGGAYGDRIWFFRKKSTRNGKPVVGPRIAGQLDKITLERITEPDPKRRRSHARITAA